MSHHIISFQITPNNCWYLRHILILLPVADLGRTAECWAHVSRQGHTRATIHQSPALLVTRDVIGSRETLLLLNTVNLRHSFSLLVIRVVSQRLSPDSHINSQHSSQSIRAHQDTTQRQAAIQVIMKSF